MMFSLILCVCNFLEAIQLIYSQATNINGVFIKGNVKFTWTPDKRRSAESEHVIVFPSNARFLIEVSHWGTYTEKDIYSYREISIIVQTRFKDGTRPVKSNPYNFTLPRIIKAVPGENKEIEIPLDFIPSTGGYSIKIADTDVEHIKVCAESVTSKDPSKYEFVSRKDSDPQSITIKIKDITSKDAGFISTRVLSTPNGPGVLLVVTGSPTKPTIAGNADIQVGQSVTLTCISKTTSVPLYFKMLPPFTYTWFRNNSEIIGKTSSNQWVFTVRKRDKYSSITCISREEINSVSSEIFKLNPQYGPDTVTISPGNPTSIELIEGERFGPYTCSADCNPPCTYQWKKQRSQSLYDDKFTGGPILTIQAVDKNDTNKYTCQVSSNFTTSAGSTIAIKDLFLNVLWDVLPPVSVSGHAVSESSIQLTWKANNASIPVTTYFIYQLFEASWEIIANTSGEYKEKTFAYVVDQRLRPQNNYSFGIMSCNAKKCSTLQKLLGIYTLGLTTSNSMTSLDTATVIGISIVVILVLSSGIAICIRKILQGKTVFDRKFIQGAYVTENIYEINDRQSTFLEFSVDNVCETINESTICPTNHLVPSTILIADNTGEEHQNTQNESSTPNLRAICESENVMEDTKEYESVCLYDKQKGDTNSHIPPRTKKYVKKS